jgi:aryl-alcohol dehydrogenase-like predicted oxidoreductase
VKISTIVLGCWGIGGLFWGGSDERDSIAAIQRSIDEGVTSLDTAPIYGCGASEELVGRAIKGRRDEVQILTKFGLRWDTNEGTRFFDIEDSDGSQIVCHKLSTRASIVAECEASLRRLGTDHIDLYQHHWPDPACPMDETFAAIERLLKDGKILAAGVSNYSVAQIEEAARRVPIASNQPPYSMVRRGIEADVLPHCRERNIGIIVYSPMQMGLLSGKMSPERVFPATDIRSQRATFSPENRRRVNAFLDKLRPIAEAHEATLANVVVRWTLQRPGVTAALVGARTPAQAAENARAGGFELSAAEMAFIDAELEGLRLEE